MRYVERTFLYVQRGILENVQVARKSEVLLIGRIEVQMIARVAAHLHSVLYIKVIKRYGGRADGGGEGILQQPDVVVIDVHIGENLLQQRVHYVARLYYFVHTLALLSHDDVSFLARVFAV